MLSVFISKFLQWFLFKIIAETQILLLKNWYLTDILNTNSGIFPLLSRYLLWMTRRHSTPSIVPRQMKEKIK